MRFPHLFEFMDLDWLPASLHATLREILECGNARPFRPYYGWVAGEVKRLIELRGLKNVVELGAGTAPVTRVLAEDASLNGVHLIVCDTQPDEDTYRDLEKRYAGKVSPRYEPIDFARPQHWPPKSILVLSGTFHHIPPAARQGVLQSLTRSGNVIIMCEPLRKTALSMCFVFLSMVPAFLLPLWYFLRPGRLRRFFWCWLFPITPVIFWWDGLVSCLRMWTGKQWQANLRSLIGSDATVDIRHSTFSQLVVWQGEHATGGLLRNDLDPQGERSETWVPLRSRR